LISDPRDRAENLAAPAYAGSRDPRHAGSSSVRVAVGAVRVTFWGALAVGLTAGAGAICRTFV
jgi:hypothetical protein